MCRCRRESDFHFLLAFYRQLRFDGNVSPPQRAVIAALKSDDTLDCERLAVTGGSHGGFLSCHLIGQFPEVYRACAVRNPVVNAATLLGTSDIVDWWGLIVFHSARQPSCEVSSHVTFCPQAVLQRRAPVLVPADTHCGSSGRHAGEVAHRARCSGQTAASLILWGLKC